MEKYLDNLYLLEAVAACYVIIYSCKWIDIFLVESDSDIFKNQKAGFS